MRCRPTEITTISEAFLFVMLSLIEDEYQLTITKYFKSYYYIIIIKLLLYYKIHRFCIV